MRPERKKKTMPVDSKGGFHLHPGAAKMHDSAPKAPPIGKPAHEAGGKGHVEFHHGAAPGGSGKYHTIHHPSGEVKDHPDAHAAHQAMNEHMGEDGCQGGAGAPEVPGASSEDYS